MTVSYSINGKSIKPEELREIQITKKDYIDYVESMKQSASNSFKEQIVDENGSNLHKGIN